MVNLVYVIVLIQVYREIFCSYSVLICCIHISEKAGKKSALKKKTTISVNGQLLPIAALSTTDKNVHITVQQAPQGATGQLNQPVQPLQQNQLTDQSTFQHSPPQPLVQELKPGITTLQVPGTFNSPPNLQGQALPSSLSLTPQTTGTFHSPPNLQAQGLLNSPTNTISGQGTFHSPANLQEQGSLNSPLNPLQGQGIVNTQQTATQGQMCNPVQNTVQTGNQPASTLVHIGRNSQGELTYQPLGC